MLLWINAAMAYRCTAEKLQDKRCTEGIETVLAKVAFLNFNEVLNLTWDSVIPRGDIGFWICEHESVVFLISRTDVPND